MRTFLLTVGALATAIAAAGCGGDDNEQSANRTATAQTESSGAATTEAETATDQDATGDQDTSGGDPTEAPPSTAPDTDTTGDHTTTSDDQPANPAGGSDNAQDAGSTVVTFFKAIANGDGNEACSLMADRVKQQLEKSLGQAPQFKGKGCAGVIATISKTYPQATRTQLGSVSIIKTERQGDDSVLVTYKGGATPKATIAVVDEDGTWKIGTTGTSAATP
jgi:hypothetical protein